MKILFSITTFLSAFLLMVIQPILAKKLLPWFGSSPAAWLSVILFFQTALFLGYFYAFLLQKIHRQFYQNMIQLCLMLACCTFLPIAIIIPENIHQIWPPIAIMSVLGASILCPIILLSSTSPLLQVWYAQYSNTTMPYRFYAISNLGSILGLFAFPLLFEPIYGLSLLMWSWSIAFGILLIAVFFCLGIFPRRLYSSTSLSMLSHAIKTTEPKPTTVRFLYWIVLAFLSSALLLSTTQIILQNVLSFPLLWIIPLALYLLSFILIFGWPKTGFRPLWLGILAITTVITTTIPSHHNFSLIQQLCIYSLLLFSACMICHDALNRDKPTAHYLTHFYLAIAFGSVIGGVLVNIIAPMVFMEWWDFYCPLFAVLIFGGLQYIFENFKGWAQKITHASWSLMNCFLISILIIHLYKDRADVIYEHRNFFGRYEVIQNNAPNELRQRVLRHGFIMHGQQFMDYNKRREPTSYFSEKSGVGLALHYWRQKHSDIPMNVGVIGLGTGTIAALMMPQDTIHFYECDSDMIKLSQKWFYYLQDTPATVKITLDDGRLALQKALNKQLPGHYDLLAIDAFNGDAIPTHLLTIEAISLYLSHLNKDGILAFHISSRYLDLYPPLQAAAQKLGLHCYLTHNSSDPKQGVAVSEWVLLSRDPQIGLYLYQQNALFFRQERQDNVWTDDFSYLLSSIRWHI